MAELLNLRLHIGPIEGRKFRECKVTLDTKLMFGTEPFTPQGCCPIVSQMALPADAAAVRVRILDMEKIVNLDHQRQLTVDLDLLDHDPCEPIRTPTETALKPSLSLNPFRSDNPPTQKDTTGSPNSPLSPEQGSRSTSKPTEEYQSTDPAIGSKPPPDFTCNVRDAGVAKTPIASPLLNWDKILLSPRKHCVRGSKVISVRLPPKLTQSSPGTAETGPASASNKADDNNRSALSVKPSTDSGPMFRSDQSAKSSSFGLTTAIVDSRMELNFNTPAPRENVFRASNFDKSKSKKDKHKPLPKTLITSKSTAAGSQNERKKTTTHDLFERGKDVDLSSSAIRVNSEPKAGSQMEIKKPILNLFERGKDIDLSFSAIRANPPAKAEALFHFEPPTNIDSEAVTLFSSLFDEPVITFCDDFPYSEHSANKRQTTSADGPEKAPFGADNSSEGSFSTPELGPMHDSREGNFAKMIAHSCIDDDSSDSDASFYSLDGPTSPAEAA